MRIIIGALWLVLFLVLFAFAVNNTALTELQFFAGMHLKAPLIALLLAFFIGGFVFGFIALMPAWVRQRVELKKLRRVTMRSAEAVPPGPARAGASSPSASDNEVIQSVARGARTTT